MYKYRVSYFNRENALSKEKIRELLGYDIEPEGRQLTSEEIDRLNGRTTFTRAATPEEVKLIQLEAKRLEEELGYIPDMETILQNLNLTDIGTKSIEWLNR